MKNLPRSLQTLNISVCTLITQEGLKNLPASLTQLDISYCSNTISPWMINTIPMLIIVADHLDQNERWTI